MSTVVTAVFTPLAASRQQLLDALQEFVPRVHQEAGCELFALHEQADGTLVLIEKWHTPEALDAHDAGEPVAAFRKRLEGLLQEPAVVTTLVPIPIGTPPLGLL